VALLGHKRAVLVMCNFPNGRGTRLQFAQAGLDLHEHGISAYPQYVISSAGTPVGVADDSENRAQKVMKLESVILQENANY
jgi:hypothetical protein